MQDSDPNRDGNELKLHLAAVSGHGEQVAAHGASGKVDNLALVKMNTATAQ